MCPEIRSLTQLCTRRSCRDSWPICCSGEHLLKTQTGEGNNALADASVKTGNPERRTQRDAPDRFARAERWATRRPPSEAGPHRRSASCKGADRRRRLPPMGEWVYPYADAGSPPEHQFESSTRATSRRSVSAARRRRWIAYPCRGDPGEEKSAAPTRITDPAAPILEPGFALRPACCGASWQHGNLHRSSESVRRSIVSSSCAVRARIGSERGHCLHPALVPSRSCPSSRL
jgi:hypothetical protein